MYYLLNIDFEPSFRVKQQLYVPFILFKSPDPRKSSLLSVSKLKVAGQVLERPQMILW